jgi:hypothetical protein
MAKRFSGEDVPGDQAVSYERAQVHPVGARSNILWIPAIPLVATTFWDGTIAMSLGLIGAASWSLAAWLLREGQIAQAAYEGRKIAKRPALPRKILSSVLTGIGAIFAVLAHQDNVELLSPLLLGLIASALHAASFGLDPLRDKGLEGADTMQQDRVARIVDEAEAYLEAMGDAILRSGDRHMEGAVERFQRTARDLIRTVEEDPRDLSAARKYLGVYLMGARDATVKYADLYTRSRDPKARTDYAALLDDLTENFAARTDALLDGNRTDLSVEIDVLRERLARDGVQLARASL